MFGRDAVVARKNPHLDLSFESWRDDEELRDAVKAAAVLTPDEQAAIMEARKGGFASDRKVAAFWKRHGIDPKRSHRRRTKPSQT